MTPRLIAVCLGGLAGAGAVVCCDFDEGPESEAVDAEPAEEAAPAAEVEAEAAPLH